MPRETPEKQYFFQDPLTKTEDNVVGRCLGVYLSDSSHPAQVTPRRLRWTICCTGNCPPALYAVWDGIVNCKDLSAQINLLLNRASPLLDIDSYLPYEGKVVIRNKTAENISMRIPLWVNKYEIKCQIDKKTYKPFWSGNYMVFTELKDKDVITIEFPMVESTESYTLKWIESDFWPESTNPGATWQPLENPDKFKLYFKGNTLIDISPRPKDAVYPLYQRDHYKANKAPMKKVTRFVSPLTIKW
jgi:hypothetical protein